MNGAPAISSIETCDVDATVLICTFNRAAYLAETLDSLARIPAAAGFTWDVMVVDNNSTDETRRVVESRVRTFPVPLHYLFEQRQGKSIALNTGLAASRAAIIVFTDDDVQVAPAWLEAGVRPLLDRPDLEYTGGPVRPIWGAPPPPWLNPAGNLGGTIAVKDHGDEPFIFEERLKTPLGVNMAVRRRHIERIGGFRPDLGRSGKSLLGQEQAEFFYRSRAAGGRGLYVPEMVLDHVVPAARLTLGYFRRWWYWKGVSHARVHRLHGRTELGVDVTGADRLLGLPRFVAGNIARNVAAWTIALLRGDSVWRTERMLSLAYYLGYCRETWRPAPAPDDAGPAGELLKRTAGEPRARAL